MPITTVTLTGTYTDGAGDPVAGTVTFVPNAPLVSSGASDTIRQVPVSVKLDGSGHFSIALFATDAAGVAPSGWAWIVTEKITGSAPSRWQFLLPHANGATQDISTLEPTTSLPAVYSPIPVSGTPSAGQSVVATSSTAAHWATISGGGSADGLGLTRTAVKTGAYAAAAGDLVPVDTTSGAVTITLPAAASSTLAVGVKLIVLGGSNTVTIACAGSDTFNRASGSTTATLSRVNQTMVLQPSAAGIWTVASTDPAAVSLITAGLDASKPTAPSTPGISYWATDTQILYTSDGAAWQFALTQAEGISAPTNSVFPNLTYLIAPGAASSVLTASGGLTITQDTTNYDWGSQSIKFVTDGTGGGDIATLTLGSAVDLSDKVLVIGFEIDSFTPYNDLQVRLSSDGFGSSNYDFCKPAYTSASQRWVEPGLWELITINRGGVAGNMSAGQWASNGTGLASYASVNAIRFRLVDNGGAAPMTMRIGFLGYYTRPAAGMVSVTFDDSRLTQFTIAKPVMDANGIRGTLYNIGYNVANSGSLGSAYYSQAQMKQMQDDSHWEVGAHAYTDTTGVQAHTVGYDSLTSHDGEIDILQLRTWLKQQRAMGIDSFALPHGTWSLNSSATVGANPDVLGLMGKYFNTACTTLANTIESYPPANRLKLRRYVVTNTDTPTTLMAMVTAAIANKWWLILAFHNLPATVSNATDFSAANFQTFIPLLAASGVATPTVGEVWRQPAANPGAVAVPAGGDLAGTYPNPVLAKIAGTTLTTPPGGTTTFLRGDLTWTVPPGTGGGGLSAGDASIAIAGSSIEAGTLDQVANLHAPAADWSNNSHKITSLANGTNPGDAMAFGQLPAQPEPGDFLSWLWWTADPESGATSTVGPLTTAGTLYLREFFTRSVQTLSGLSYILATAGSGLTSAQCFMGIYDSGGTLRASTGDQSTNWAGSTGYKAASFGTPYASAPVGRYYAGFYFQGTTGPAFKGTSAIVSSVNAGLSATTFRSAISSSTGNTTAMPGSITLSGSTSPSSFPIWLAGT